MFECYPIWVTAMRKVRLQDFGAGPVGVEPGIQRRGLLVFMETLVPYLTERLQQRYDDAATDFSDSAPLRRRQYEASAASAAWWQQSMRALLTRVRRSCALTECYHNSLAAPHVCHSLRGNCAAARRNQCHVTAHRRRLHGAA